MLEGLQLATGPSSLFVIAVGVLLGIMVGALPGFTATMGTALLLPFTFSMEPGQGLAMLGALYVAAMYADAVPACLVNTPGTPSAMATAFDGFPLTQQGHAQKALVASSFSSMVGATLGGLTFLFLSGVLASVALQFGPPEFFWIGIFALTIIGSIAGDSMLKGLAGGALGMLIGTIGISATGAVSRYTFDLPDLRGGLNEVAALIGVFAMPQVLRMVANRREKHTVASYTRSPGVSLETVREILRRPVNLFRSAIIGTLVGLLPGAGSPVASLVSYNEAVRWSKDKTKFGKGSLDGVVASEAANNGAAGGAMVPLAGLGIPGSAPAAVILGALLLHGLQPGPQLFQTRPELVYGFAWAIVIAGIGTFLFGSVLAGLLARMVTIPVRLLAPIVLFLSVVGSFAIRNNIIDVFLMVGLGVGVYLLGKLGFHPGPIGLGVILGPIVEPALVQSMAMTEASSAFEVFFTRPVSLIVIVLTLISVAWVIWSKQRERQHVVD
ncbi:C4-dicarboxylate ABC transporter permease [Actinobacteria bacterium YIM 96077]|uniref:C4-dicarboxylate ABC transporter permease n=1 Tax=Phytoactinopolyspora halophila TaxID=1981511 RepID=A0A329QN77_9ACTN|nr:tripartite tricarboxylate transporter permease [Phytoactinopolyspora halophila]AYY12276.1 C4-dicarboxylate ABC transporter permease [Actinobacteria bacterium YIM 96077]RAW13807.1 C4-dicarboxylate ABC transporter permease [Phytoactinopolyspora halophila]